MDFSPLLDAISFTTVGAAILAVAGLKVAPIAIQWGAVKVLSMIKRG